MGSHWGVGDVQCSLREPRALLSFLTVVLRHLVCGTFLVSVVQGVPGQGRAGQGCPFSYSFPYCDKMPGREGFTVAHSLKIHTPLWWGSHSGGG